jgi:hypothetical protein
MRENQRKTQNNRNRKHGQQNQHTNSNDQKDKKVPMKYEIQNSKETDTIELKYTDRNGSVDKTKFRIYEDGWDEEFLKLINSFTNYLDTYEIWGDEHAAHTIYKIF